MTDVCLVLEGTWPYLTGGVAEWVDRLLVAVDDLDVTVVHLRDGAIEPPAPVYDPEHCARLLIESVDRDPTDVAGRLPVASVYHALSTGPASDVAAAAARRHGSALVVTEHGLAWREAMLGVGEIVCGRVPPPERQPWVRRLRAAATRAYAAADLVTTVCEANAREQVRLGARSPVVVPNPAPPVGEPRRGPGHPARIGYVGRVVPIKDVLSFVDAAHRLRTRLPGAAFVVAGPTDHDEEYAAEVAVAARGMVPLAGPVDGPAFIAGLDVLVLPSVSEAQPLVVLEAMAAGTPVVATAVGGVPELVGDCAVLVPPGDPAALADAIELVSRDAGLWRRLSAGGQGRAARDHRHDAMGEAYRAVYARWI